MGSLLKTSVLVGFLLLLPALVYCDRSVKIDLFVDTNCTQVPTSNTSFAITSVAHNDTSNTPNTTFKASLTSNPQTFSSAILTNVAGEVLSLVACQFGLECYATGAILIDFNLSDTGACSTAGPPGTQFDRFMISMYVGNGNSWKLSLVDTVKLCNSIISNP